MTLKLSVAAAALAFSMSTARAEPVDMSTITCGQLAAMQQEEVSFILSWVLGYVAGTAEELSMDPDALGTTVTDAVAYCAEHQEMSVLNAIKEVGAN